MMSSPTYTINQTVYLKESAALGRLEAMRISGVFQIASGDWLYTCYAGYRPGYLAGYMGDRYAIAQGAVLQFSESEFVTYQEALVLAEANAMRNLADIQAKIAQIT